MEFSRQEERVIKEVCVAVEGEVVQLLDIQLAMVGGGVADVTFS